MKVTLNIKANVESEEIALKLTQLLQNMTNTVSERDLLSLHKEVSLDKNFIKKAISKINTPFIKNLLKK